MIKPVGNNILVRTISRVVSVSTDGNDSVQVGTIIAISDDISNNKSSKVNISSEDVGKKVTWARYAEKDCEVKPSDFDLGVSTEDVQYFIIELKAIKGVE